MAAYVMSLMVYVCMYVCMYVCCIIIITVTALLCEIETWSLTRRLENRLSIPENMVVRKKLA